MNIMLDLETAASAPSAIILSIGAVHFDQEHVNEGNHFYCAVKPDLAHGVMSVDTLKWWMQQKGEARAVWNDPEAVPLDLALTRFSEWVKEWKAGYNTLMWGNGSDFDNVILGHAYDALDRKKPWSFKNNRCYRTLKGFFHQNQVNAWYKKYDNEEGFMVKHNALYDAWLQARICKDMLNCLTIIPPQ